MALTVWKLAGYQALPQPNLACSGLAPSATEAEWVALAGENYRAQRGMARRHGLFKDAPVLGSLINPQAQAGTLLEAEFRELAPLLATALAPTENDGVELAFVAQGLAKAAELLAGQYTLVTTNVPYLENGKQAEALQDHCEPTYPNSKGNWACVFVERCLSFCSARGTSAVVAINELLFLVGYRRLREHLLTENEWNCVTQLGAGAFETISGEVVKGSKSKTLEGEAPLDIFVRWKALHDQPQGWHPDLNDGVRQNIRPFLLAGDVGKKGAGLFRAVPLSLKDKDRGSEPERARGDYPWFWCEGEPGTDPVGGEEFVGSRWNGVHLTLARKRGARG